MPKTDVKKIQAIIFIFGCAMAQKTNKGNDVTFETQFLEFLSDIRQTKWHFWNPETKVDKIGRYVSKRKFWLPKFELFRPEVDLTLG